MNLIANAGFKEDFSIGYASMPGFPLGTAHPVFFYDIINDKQTELVLHQTAIMDSSFVDYKNLIQMISHKVLIIFNHL